VADLRCLHCNGDRFASTSEEPGLGDPIICGQCGALMVLDTVHEEPGDDVERWRPNGVRWRPVLRRPSRHEATVLRKMPRVAELLNLYQAETLRLAAEKTKASAVPRRLRRRAERMSKPITIYGPDHPKHRDR